MKKLSARFVFFVLALALLGQAQAPGKTSVAVYPIKAVGGVDKSLAQTMTSLLGYELSQSPKLIYIREDMLKEVMKRQAQGMGVRASHNTLHICIEEFQRLTGKRDSADLPMPAGAGFAQSPTRKSALATARRERFLLREGGMPFPFIISRNEKDFQRRFSGFNPVFFAIRASMRGPISSRSWKAKTKSG